MALLQVKVLWVINAVQKNWEKQLPDETQGTLAKSRTQKGGLYEKDTAAAKGAPDSGAQAGWKALLVAPPVAESQLAATAAPQNACAHLTPLPLPPPPPCCTLPAAAARCCCAAGKAKDELKMFPYISTFDANYSPELVGLLSQQATWQMLQLEPQLKKLVGGSKVTVSAPRNVGTATTDENKGSPTKSSSAAQGLGSSARLAPWLALAAAALAGLLAL